MEVKKINNFNCKCFKTSFLRRKSFIHLTNIGKKLKISRLQQLFCTAFIDRKGGKKENQKMLI